MDTVRLETQGPIAYIRLNRPEALNAFNDAMFHDLNAALDRYRDDPELKAAIISGEGERAFSAGIDLKSYSADLEAGRSRKEPRLSHCCNPDYCGKPIIAAIRGYCIGEGVQLALACDFRVCASDAIFALPEVELGIAITRMCWHCVRVIGMPAAIEFCLLAEKKDAAWALAHQLVHRVTLPGEELAAAEKIALRLASLSPAALQATKKALYKAFDLNYKEMLDFSLPLVGAVLDTGDARTGTRAFVAKREPRFVAKDSADS